ncbi:substrate-binding domain-containing protein [Rubritalea sp.]|uniref:phosphate ABC transporter substrate-binding/OmpA family protein n=1 Tax=Rubritalea sp. TaxID=2109375 RepID=UPI003EF53AC8
MKTHRKITWIVGLMMAMVVSFVHADAQKEEFASLQQSRESRTALVSYLQSTSHAKETASGMLRATSDAPAEAKRMIDEENKDRDRMFTIIASMQNQSKAEVARQFAVRMGVDVSEPELVTTLRIHGSNTVGASLAPELVMAFLGKRGYSEIAVEREGVESQITYRRPGKKELGVVEIKAHGSSTAFDETDANKKVGLYGKFCDIGMASRPMKDKEQVKLTEAGFGDMRTAASEFPIALDGVAVVLNRSNPIKSLTVEQVAQLFSGKITNWKQLGGPDQEVYVYARDEQSGTWDTFKSRVLKPFKLSLTEKNVERFEDSSLLVRSVASNKGGIGFTGLAYVDSSVKGLAVQSGEEARPFQPTRLTVKTQDYPLARLLYFYLPIDSSQVARDFVKFVMSNEGQAVVDRVGLVGQGLSTKKDQNNAESLKKQLLADPSVPQEYKDHIVVGDRKDTQANIRFVQGSNEPDINSINNLDRLSSSLANSGNESVSVVLIGFADSVGGQSANLRLSKERADSVRELLEAKGVTNIISAGFGEAMPVADNGSEDGRSQNRRVEIWLKRN